MVVVPKEILYQDIAEGRTHFNNIRIPQGSSIEWITVRNIGTSSLLQGFLNFQADNNNPVHHRLNEGSIISGSVSGLILLKQLTYETRIRVPKSLTGGYAIITLDIINRSGGLGNVRVNWGLNKEMLN